MSRLLGSWTNTLEVAMYFWFCPNRLSVGLNSPCSWGNVSVLSRLSGQSCQSCLGVGSILSRLLGILVSSIQIA